MKLHSVPKEPEQVIDISALLRADALKRDWSTVHTEGDKQKSVPLKQARKWRFS